MVFEGIEIMASLETESYCMLIVHDRRKPFS